MHCTMVGAGFGTNHSITRTCSLMKNEDPKEIFWQECQMFFLQDYLSKCEIVDVNGGDILELQLKDSGEPVLAMILAE